jgi:hypothetical protein
VASANQKSSREESGPVRGGAFVLGRRVDLRTDAFDHHKDGSPPKGGRREGIREKLAAGVSAAGTRGAPVCFLGGALNP